MSATRYGLTIGDLIAQPDFSARQSEHGGWEASQSYVIRKGGIDQAAIRNLLIAGKRAVDLDDGLDVFFSFLKLVSISDIATIEGGWTRVSVEFSGFLTAMAPVYQVGTTDEEEYPTYSMRGTLEDAPFSRHTKWTALTAAEKDALGFVMAGTMELNYDTGEVGMRINSEGDPDPWAQFDVKFTLTGDALEFARRISQGDTTFKQPSFQWVKRWEGSVGLTAAQLDLLGHISAAPSGNPPKPSGGRNWLLVGANQEQTGGGDGVRFVKEIEYLLSDRGGHDSFLYST